MTKQATRASQEGEQSAVPEPPTRETPAGPTLVVSRIRQVAPKLPRDRSKRWAWREGRVDPAGDHFELRYGSVADSDWKQWVLVARVGGPIKKVFAVHFLIDRANPAHAQEIGAVVSELDFYLVTKGETNPWAYAQYHCGTASNVYSSVHWSFFAAKPTGSAG